MLRLMFRPTSECFANVRCPKLSTCRLPHCLFSHTAPKRSISTETEASQTLLKRTKLMSPSPGTSSPEPLTPPPQLQPDVADIKVPTPLPLPGVGAPATHQQRNRYIAGLIEAYELNKVPLPRKTAVDNEYKIAVSSTSNTYNVKMKQFLQKAKMNAIHYFTPEKGRTRTLSMAETYDAVFKLIPTLTKLQFNGYVTEIPEKAELATTRKCDRCGESFAISEILKDSKCRFHERKKRFEKTNKYWECCDQVVGESQGCKTSEHHVFKAGTAQELHALIPFKETTLSLSSNNQKRIVGLDCEMGYTSKGMELIRLTIMDFHNGKVLYDDIVKPSGVVLDLNTHWSGVSEIPDTAKTLEETLSSVLGSIINKGTIIVGHGLENDLNTLRLVHHQVVDTAILFPKSLTRKYALKDLAFQFLNRKIQSGQHSSEEDSLAAIDIVKAHISRTDL